MCWQDVEIGRNTVTIENTATLGVAPVQLVPAADNRFGLLIESHPTADFEISINPAFAAGSGLMILHGQQPLMLNITFNGDIVRRCIYASCAAATPIILVWQTMLQGKPNG